MRTIHEIHHPLCRVTIMLWNQKYLIKLEQESLEQTFKVSQFDVSGDDAVIKTVTEEFIQGCVKRFDEMRSELNKLVIG